MNISEGPPFSKENHMKLQYRYSWSQETSTTSTSPTDHQLEPEKDEALNPTEPIPKWLWIESLQKELLNVEDDVKAIMEGANIDTEEGYRSKSTAKSQEIKNSSSGGISTPKEKKT
jgi:hypothetical protein